MYMYACGYIYTYTNAHIHTNTHIHKHTHIDLRDIDPDVEMGLTQLMRNDEKLDEQLAVISKVGLYIYQHKHTYTQTHTHTYV